MNRLKLAALDDEDLIVISAQLQDAVLKAHNIHYAPKTGQFAMVLNRFIHQDAAQPGPLRCRTNMHFNRITNVQTRNWPAVGNDSVLSLLAITFTPGNEAPHGVITINFSNDIDIRLEVECIEAQMEDSDQHWPTQNTPHHDFDNITG